MIVLRQSLCTLLTVLATGIISVICDATGAEQMDTALNVLSDQNNVTAVLKDLLSPFTNLSSNPTAIRDSFKQLLNNDDIFLNITQLLKKYGYPSEQHTVQTSDGYLLNIIRIPNTGPAVFLMHGHLTSSDDFLTIGPQAGLAYIVWNAGYDVWLGNARGTKHSKGHVRMSTDSADFWNFSWDEIGRYDMASMIDYALATTKQTQIKLIGYSQGTTASFVLLSERPEYNSKVSIYVALAPVAWFSHNRSPVLTGLAKPIDLAALGLSLGTYAILTDDDLVETVTTILCGTPDLALSICHTILFSSFGPDYEQINKTSLPVIYGHMPTSSSTKQVVHFDQSIRSGKFRLFDYGATENLLKYGSIDPPDYPVQKITTKVAIFVGNRDWVSVPKDVQNLIDNLPNIIEVYKIPFEKFSHTDFVYGRDVKSLVYNKVIEILNAN